MMQTEYTTGNERYSAEVQHVKDLIEVFRAGVKVGLAMNTNNDNTGDSA